MTTTTIPTTPTWTVPRSAGLNVMNYGAVGDGNTDDTTAINSGIAASVAAGKTLYFPAGTYKVTSGIQVPSGCSLAGLTSAASVIVITDPGDASGPRIFEIESVSNVTFAHLGVESTLADLTASSELIHVSGASNIHLHHLALGTCYYGIKTDSGTGVNTGLSYHDLVMDAFTALYISYTSDSRFYNLDLTCYDIDVTPDATHQIYIDDACANLTFDQLILRGGMSNAMGVSSNNGGETTHDVTVTNVELINVYLGLLSTESTYNVLFSGITGTSIKSGGKWFGTFNSGSGDVTFENFTLSAGAESLLHFAGDMVGKVITVRNGTLPSVTGTGIELSGGISLVMDNVDLTAHAGSNFFHCTAGSYYTLLDVDNCAFTWIADSAMAMSLRGAGAADFANCVWTAPVGSVKYCCYNITAGAVTWHDASNTVVNFMGIKHANDTQTTVV